MIVISHSWEFIPKGSSHFNYHINSAKSTAANNPKDTVYKSLNKQQQHQTASTTTGNAAKSTKYDSINESYNLLSKLALDNCQQNESLILNEKWHLKQSNEYSENEIYIKDGTVILSNGHDFESKIVDRCYSFDSPVVECNWFNFKGGPNDTEQIKDAICVFEQQKLHVYYPSGADFHINLSFKIKNVWKLKDGILIEKIPDLDNSIVNPFRFKQLNPILFSLSHPLNELKPVLYRPLLTSTTSTDSTAKILYWKETTKQIIIDVIESLDLLLAFNSANNLHYIYRINDVIYSSDEPNETSSSPAAISKAKTPVARASSAASLSMNLQQSSKRRLSVSPIVSFNQQSRFNLNTPAITINNASITTANTSIITSTTTTTTTAAATTATTTLHQTHHIPHSYLHAHRNFSPMAALSRSPSCSSSPAILSLATQSNNQSNRRSLIPLPTISHQQQANTSIVNPLNTFMTPIIDQCKTPQNNNHLHQTPTNLTTNNNNNNRTPHYTGNEMLIDNDDSNNELPIAEYVIEYLWNEPNDLFVNEKATKFFYSVDLYGQKYICYLVPSKAQLRCLKCEYNADKQSINIGSFNSINNCKDAIFVEARNLLVILDTTGNLIVYSGLTKLCRLHIHNLPSKSFTNSKNNFSAYKSPVISPVKLKLANLIDEEASISNDADTMPNTSADSITVTSSKTKQQTGFTLALPIQNEFKAVLDATGSRFTIKLNDSRLVRVNINEITTCKLVSMCLEGFKLTLNTEIYYEIIQQWFIHRFTISESLNDQLNLFLYLLISLCGCFDMKRLENEMKFLFSFNQSVNTRQQQQQQSTSKLNTNRQQTDSNETANLEDTLLLEYNTNLNQNNSSTQSSSIDSLVNAKRVKSNYDSQLNATDDDWEFLINNEQVQKHFGINNEFEFLKQISNKTKTKRVSITHQQQQRNTTSTTTITSGANNYGILYPYLKHILYTLHLIYEEAKLYRSLKIYLNNFVQVLYLFSQELNLQHYLNYYEQEHPFLLDMKIISGNCIQVIPLSISQQQQRLSIGNLKEPPIVLSQSTPQMTANAPTLLSNVNNQATAFNNLRSKYSPSTQLTYIISQEPPNLNKFLLKLIDINDQSKYQQSTTSSHDESYLFEKLRTKTTSNTMPTIQNPFPILSNVSQRTIQALKLYSLISLICKLNNKLSYKDYLNQLMLKINLTGFQSNLQTLSSTHLDSLDMNKMTKCELYKHMFQLCIYDMNIEITDDLYDYTYSMIFPIYEALNYARENPSLEWPTHVFNLIGRFDLEILKSMKYSESTASTPGLAASSATAATVMNSNSNYISTCGNSSNGEEFVLQIRQNLKKEEEDGMQHLNDLDAYKCRFNEDLRLKEIRSCLQTTRPIQIKLTQGPDVSDHDFVEEEERFLFCICQRTMSLPIARGILTLHTIDPIPTEPVQIPELNLKGKSVTKKTTIDLTRIEVPVNMTYWPLFHNGVAAGLTISPLAKDLSNAWIKSHLAKNFELTNEQAGFLYGLGLTGHLANFSMLNVHDALTRRHDLTNISILLGLAASKISSMDINVIRLISMHIRALMPPVEIELEIPYNIQIAALLSLGLVYAKSGNKHISYVLLKEIGRLPSTDMDKDVHTFDREAYSLSSGLALGLVLLEKGKHSLTIMDSMFTDELYHYMVGGHKERYYDTNGNYYTSSSAALYLANGHTTVRMSGQTHSDQGGGGNGANGGNGNNTNGANINGTGGTGGGGGGGGAQNINFINYSKNINSSHIREGDTINTNVTSPGATLALGLIYFNTCDKSIAEWFSPPDSIYLLDSIRPDFLLLRTLARNLIMWKYILPTKKWVIKQLPKIYKMKNSNKKKPEYEINLKKKLSKVNLNSNNLACLLESSEDEDEEANEENVCINNGTNNNDDDIDNESDDNININFNDLNTKTEAFQHIIAGVCFSIALKFAGTCNNDAYNTLLYWANYFIDINDQRLSSENSLCVVVLSLAILMAGSGDLEVLRICRYLRSRVGPTYNFVLYGSHMAVNMALSLLFMGGGRYTFKTDSLSIALMICAFYPHFPIDSNDNRFHLQAFRHLYVLATESRLLLTKDVDTNSYCYVPIEITLKPTEHYGTFKYTQMAPCIVPELDKIKEVKVLGPRYYSIKFDDELNFIDLRNILTTHLYVKQKNGYFSYSDDPKDEKAYNIRNFLSKTIVPRRITPELLESITSDEHINLFAKMLNKCNDVENETFNDKTNRLLKIIYESVIQDTFDFVGVILQLDKEVNDDPLNTLFVEEMNLINAFYRLIPTKKNHIIAKDFLFSVTNKLETRLRQSVKNQLNAIKLYLNYDYVDGVDDIIHFCIYYDINKSELNHFITCNNLTDLLKVPSNNIRIEKLLYLYQVIKLKQ